MPPVKLSHSSCSAKFCCVLADFCSFFLREAIVRPSLSSNLTLLRFLQNFNFTVGFSNSGRWDLRQLVGTTSLLEVAPHDSPRVKTRTLNTSHIHVALLHRIYTYSIPDLEHKLLRVVIFAVLIFANGSNLAKNAKITNHTVIGCMKY